MAWTVNISKSIDNNSKVVKFTYTDGRRVVADSFDVQGGLDIQRIASSKIDWLQAQDALFDAIPEGVLQVEPSVVDPLALPSQDEIEKQEFLANYTKLQRLTVFADKGILASDDQSITDLKSSLQKAFKPEYAEGL